MNKLFNTSACNKWIKIIVILFCICPTYIIASENIIPFSSEQYDCDKYFDIYWDFLYLEDDKLIIKEGNKILTEGYNGKRIYQLLALSYYQVGENEKAINTLIESTKQKYICGISIPPRSLTGLAIDYALEHYHLYELLSEKGKTKVAAIHLAKAEEIIKAHFKEEYTEKIKNNIFRMFSLTKKNET